MIVIATTGDKCSKLESEELMHWTARWVPLPQQMIRPVCQYDTLQDQLSFMPITSDDAIMFEFDVCSFMVRDRPRRIGQQIQLSQIWVYSAGSGDNESTTHNKTEQTFLNSKYLPKATVTHWPFMAKNRHNTSD